MSRANVSNNAEADQSPASESRSQPEGRGKQRRSPQQKLSNREGHDAEEAPSGVHPVGLRPPFAGLTPEETSRRVNCGEAADWLLGIRQSLDDLWNAARDATREEPYFARENNRETIDDAVCEILQMVHFLEEIVSKLEGNTLARGRLEEMRSLESMRARLAELEAQVAGGES